MVLVCGPGELNMNNLLTILIFLIFLYNFICKVMVQRVLASKDVENARGGCLLAGYLKLLPLFLLIFPGMAARVLYQDTVGCSTPSECRRVCGSAGGCTNIAYAELVMNLMPHGLAGMMLGLMLFSLVCSLIAIVNSSTTIITIDIWTRLSKNPGDKELLIVGRQEENSFRCK